MYRWIEQTDSLRLEFSQTSRAGCLTSTSGLLLMAAQVTTIGVLASVPAMRRDPGCFLAPLAATIALCAVAWAALRKADQMTERSGWVEVAIRGGLARWGAPGQVVLPEVLPVRRFDVIPTPHDELLLVARLDGDRRCTVFGPWHASAGKLMSRMASDLNAYLCTPEDLATAG